MATPIIDFVMASSETLKRPAEAEGEAETDEPASKVPRVTQPQSFKNVFKQLTLMRPGLFFEMEKDTEAAIDADGIPSSYCMVVDVDGEKFKGVGPSKRNAKVHAAEQVLAHLERLGVKPREPTEGEKPPKTSEPKVKTETLGLTEEQKAQQLSGKNPVMMLHEIKPNFDSEIESDERRGAHRKVVISVTVDGTKYIGVGRSNKNARARAAVAALTSMFGLEFTEFGENEIPVYLGEEWNWRKYTKRAEKTSGVQSQQKADNSVKQIKNAVMQLNDMYKGLEFTVIERTGPDHCPFFRVSVDIEGQKYEGEGSTKKSAKLDAAEHALEGLGQTGVLASRTSAKKQQTWNKKGGSNWDKGGFMHENGNMGGYGHGGGGNFWGDNREQNGQAGMRGRGRGGRGGPRGRAGQMRGGGARGGPMHGGPMRGRGTPRGHGSWGGGGDNANSASTLLGSIGRGRGGAASMLPLPPPPPPPPPPPATRARGGRGKGVRGSATHLATMPASSWGSSSSNTGTDYSSYQDPYTSDTSTGWNSQSYGYDSKAYGQSYGYDSKSYADNSYDVSYDTSYDKTFGGGNSSYLNDSSYKSYQATDATGSATGTWGDYYGY